MAYHHGDLRQALIDATRDELSEHGPNGLSLRGVARRAGVSRSAPYHHFDGKSDLLARVAERGYRELIACIDEALDEADDDPESRLVATGIGYIRFALSDPPTFKLMFQRQYVDPSQDDELRAASDESFGKLVAAIEDVYEAHGLDDRSPIRDAILAWSTVHGFATLAVEGAMDWVDGDFEQLANAIAERLEPLFAM
jgi:AcrR family transcriptional regulator